MAEHVKKEELHEEKSKLLFCVPKNLRKIGQTQGEREIYIEDYVMSFIKYLGRESTKDYKVAIFLGEYREIEEKQSIFIYGALEVEDVNIEEGKCFPKGIWEKIYHEIEENFKGSSIVGWVVTKAGIELEATELLEKLHIDNFSGQDKTMMLYDTLEREECFFVFERRHLRKLEGYNIFYEKNPEMQNYMLKKKGIMPTEEVDDYVTKEMKKKLEEMETKKKKNAKVKKKWKMAFVLVMMGAITISWKKIEDNEKWKITKETINSTKEEVEKNKESFVEQKQARITIPKELVDEQQKKTKKEELEQEEKQKEDDEHVWYYTIQPGDTMVSICMSQYQSLEKMDEILKINHIQNKNKIVAGQRIKLNK